MTPPHSPIATEIVVDAYGVRVRIALPEGGWRDPVIERLPPGWTPAPDVQIGRRYRISDIPTMEDVWSLAIDDRPPDSYKGRNRLLDELEGDIQLFVAEFASPHLFLHAGVVGWQGEAILLPGRSRAGKSTLVTSLVRAGATYLSDEYAVLDHDGWVHPYPRRVSLRTGPLGPAARLDLAGQATAPVMLHVGLVALLQYVPASGWEVHALSPMGGVMAMCEHTVALRRRPDEAIAILGRVTRQAGVVQGTRGEVDEAVQRLLGGSWW